jgi:hypothetical protein
MTYITAVQKFKNQGITEFGNEGIRHVIVLCTAGKAQFLYHNRGSPNFSL